MSDDIDISDAWGKSKKWVIGLGLTGFALVTGMNSYEPIESGNFAVRTRFGQVLDDSIPAGVKFKTPYVDDIYKFQKNTIILETTAGSGRNTKDQNVLSAEMRFHYTINPKKERQGQNMLALHLDDMSDESGKDLLVTKMDESFNAVVGERPADAHTAAPVDVLKSFANNFQWRLVQNNIPTDVDAIELLTLSVGDGANPYRLPVQLRITNTGTDKKGEAIWKVEKMAGAAGDMTKSTEKPVATTKDTLKIAKLQ